MLRKIVRQCSHSFYNLRSHIMFRLEVEVYPGLVHYFFYTFMNRLFHFRLKAILVKTFPDLAAIIWRWLRIKLVLVFFCQSAKRNRWLPLAEISNCIKRLALNQSAQLWARIIWKFRISNIKWAGIQVFELKLFFRKITFSGLINCSECVLFVVG